MEGHCFFKKSLFFLLVTIVCYSTSVDAQNMSVENKVKPAFKDYFGLPRASVFLHLNKSAYVKGEEIWFKGYLYNRLKGIPFKEPLNLYVGVYDSNGNQIKKELFISENGISQGQIIIDSTFTGGLYYLKATTSWMRNFKEDDSYVQQFKVIEGAESVVENGKGDIDVQFLPEGGHLVAGVQGTVGVKVLNELGYGINGMEGHVKNKFGDSIASFTTNRFGLAKFDLLPKRNMRYTAYIKNGNGNEERILLPSTKEKGIGMLIKRISSSRIMILLGTNPVTRSEIGNKSYSLLIHRDGLLKNMEVNFPPKEHYVSYILDNSELHKGMNIVTLIDNRGNPVAERLVFNSNGFENGKLSSSLKILEKDSVQFTLFNNKNSDSLQFLSASILPLGTQAYQHKKNILSAFSLSPYVRGFIEHPSYYFTETSTEKENALDLLLLTQGWSRFDWKNIFDNPPVKTYDFKTGVDLYGKLNFKLPKNHELILYPGDIMEPKKIDIKHAQDYFKLDNYYFEKGTELKMTVVDANGRLSRPNLYMRINDGVSADKVYETRRENHRIDIIGGIGRYSLKDFILPKNTIELEEVIVTEKKEKRRFTSPIIDESRLTLVTKETVGNYPQLLDLIRSSGFNIWEMPNTGYDRIRITSKRPSRFSLTPPSPRLYVNDIPYADFNILQDFPTESIVSYFIDRSGNGEPGAAGGVIRVYTGERGESGIGSYSDATPDPNFFTYTLKSGFTPIKEFYVPKYRSYSDEAFINFGTIHWEPNMVIDNRKAAIVFDAKGWTEFEIFIEGMGNDGTLFSTRKTIRLDSSQ
ncbi:hypothetical protein [Maribacter aestuarii]|uniref:hypothetical protein n=1 Tax=Maribacter aestuarii TaxID=1130723 RepID=UPI0025A586E5|nr:hypothetical protein [Maribacter aestuarii]